MAITGSESGFWNVFGTDNQEKDEKQSQNDKTGLGMEKTVKDKAKSMRKGKSQFQSKISQHEMLTGQRFKVKPKFNPMGPKLQERNISLGAEIAKP
ncbi:hypothetical protein Tco_0821118 [Tanacetum coccineum]|uniref:Uncharacterized protein n=1 Tax=Tanacetum coccineum TaxID=301880 RepID=A0ABQ5AG41_9ASTR